MLPLEWDDGRWARKLLCQSVTSDVGHLPMRAEGYDVGVEPHARDCRSRASAKREGRELSIESMRVVERRVELCVPDSKNKVHPRVEVAFLDWVLLLLLPTGQRSCTRLGSILPARSCVHSAQSQTSALLLKLDFLGHRPITLISDLAPSRSNAEIQKTESPIWLFPQRFVIPQFRLKSEASFSPSPSRSCIQPVARG